MIDPSTTCSPSGNSESDEEGGRDTGVRQNSAISWKFEI